MSLLINGRFVTQALSGVQRFAVELTKASLARSPGTVLLTPPGGASAWPGSREIGKFQGQLWEQFELPRHLQGGLLVNLGNTGPVLARRQIVVIHDAGVFSTPEAYSRAFRIWYRFLQTLLVRRGAIIVTVSEFSRQEIIRHLGVAHNRVRVISEGADHMQRIGTDASILATHGLAPGKYVLGVGTLAPHKNLAALNILAERLHARGMSLVLAGGMGGAAFQTATAARLPQPARYIGRVTDAQLKSLYQAAGCFVFPSRYEGFGLPPVEAMACGCPVAASDIPALRETCGEAAAFFDPASPAHIATSVLGILDDPHRAEALRTAGLAHAANLTWAKAAAMFCAIADDLETSS